MSMRTALLHINGKPAHMMVDDRFSRTLKNPNFQPAIVISICFPHVFRG
jgi:hypothetical protein